MPELTRRNAVRAGVLSLAGLAGCSTGSGSSTKHKQPRLDRVRVSNSLSQEVSLDLQLELDGDVVFWQDVSLPGTNDWSNNSGNQSVQGATFTPPAFPQKRGEWLVRARVRDTEETFKTLFSKETTAESCLDIGVNVQQDGVEITYVATHDCAPAGTTTTES
ncbi:hypothetical protein [Halobacterium zhouii]|uniref:hypothetical protein n=1 Tax=Halobacterium zhouii TaxID=2902624 RepID=UPI001E3F7C3A|nr:hypothetical protein [Halobacterium zhouii]